MRLRFVVVGLVVAAAAACGTGAPSPTPRPAATSFDEYAVGFCSAWAAMFRAVGNPDTASGSDLSKALDAAVAAGDVGAADRLAAEITSVLESGREQVAYAGGWLPAAPITAQLDRLFVAYEAMIAAKAAAAKSAPNAVEPQAAFEGAGGVDAFFAMIEAMRALAPERPAEAQQCPNLPIGP